MKNSMLMIVLLASCGQAHVGDDECSANNTNACEGGARVFAPNNVGAIFAGINDTSTPSLRGSISNVSGPIGCGLRDSYDASPGLAAESIYLTLNYEGTGCRNGTYSLDPGCDLDAGFGAYPSGCAIYRRWNTERLESIEALAGAVTISATAGSCSVQVDLVADGEQMTTRFTVEGSESCTQPN